MFFLELMALAIALSMDALAVSVSSGMALKRPTASQYLRMSLAFGVFQALMPLTGWLLGNSVRHLIEQWDHWIAFIQDLKSLGMSLEAILDYIKLAKLGDISKEERKQIIMEVQNTLLDKIRILHTMVKKNNYHLEHYDDVLLPKTNELIYRFK